MHTFSRLKFSDCAPYGFSLAMVLAAAAVYVGLDAVVAGPPHVAPVVLFVPVLVGSAWFLGSGPFFASAVLATAVVFLDILLLQPRHVLLQTEGGGRGLATLAALAVSVVAIFSVWPVTLAARVGAGWAGRGLQAGAQETGTQSDAYAAHLVENMGEIFIAVDAELRIKYVNKATLRYANKPASELLGRTLWELSPQLAESRFAALAEEVMKTRQRVTTEILAPETQRYLQITIVPLEDGGLSLFGSDVHEQRMIERALAESDRRIGEVVDQMGDCFLAVDRRWRINAINTHGAAFARTTVGEAIGRPFWEIFAYTAGTELETVLRRAMDDQKPARHTLTGPSTGRKFDVMILPTNEGLSVFARDVTPLRAAADVAEDEQRKLRALVDAMPALVAQMDRDRRYVVVNRAYTEWFGLNSNEMAGKYIWEIIGRDAYGHLKPYIDRVLAGEEVRFESLVPYARCGQRWVDVNLVPHEDSSGAVVGYFALVQDVTRRHDQEEELRHAKERLELAQSAARLGTWEWDIAAGRVVWTESLEQIHGLEPGTFCGTLEAALADMHPDDVPRARERIEAAMSGESEAYANEYRIVLPNGQTRWIEAHGRIIRTDSGEPQRIVGVCADITDRKVAELALKESETRFRTMADGAPVLVWLADRSKEYTWFNKPWLEFAGRTMEELVTNRWTVDVHPEDRERCLRIYRTSFDAGKPFQMEYRMRRHDGVYRWVLDHGVPLQDSEGEFTGYIGSCIDITERRETEEALERHARDLARSNQDLQDFAYIASHDLKEPLRGISNYATFVREDYADKIDDDGREMLESMSRQCKRMYSLLDALLVFSRVGKSGLRPTKFDLHQLCREAVESLAAGENAEIRIECEPGSMVCADRTLLMQVFVNLISNSLKYNASEHKLVEIGILKAESQESEIGLPASEPAGTAGGGGGGGMVFWVRDNGIGIERRHQQKIFGMFKRLHARDAYGGGTGTGLAIVRRIIERHGGRVWVESPGTGLGTTFSFTLGHVEQGEGGVSRSIIKQTKIEGQNLRANELAEDLAGNTLNASPAPRLVAQDNEPQ